MTFGIGPKNYVKRDLLSVRKMLDELAAIDPVLADGTVQALGGLLAVFLKNHKAKQADGQAYPSIGREVHLHHAADHMREDRRMAHSLDVRGDYLPDIDHALCRLVLARMADPGKGWAWPP